MSIVLYHLTNIYKIYVYCWKLSNLFVQALKTSRKLKRVFVICLTSGFV